MREPRWTPKDVFDNAPDGMKLIGSPIPFEINIQLDNLHSDDNMVYWAFDKSEAQTLMEIMRTYYKSEERAYEIKWRNWSKLNEQTGEPIWVMFPW